VVTATLESCDMKTKLTIIEQRNITRFSIDCTHVPKCWLNVIISVSAATVFILQTTHTLSYNPLRH